MMAILPKVWSLLNDGDDAKGPLHLPWISRHAIVPPITFDVMEYLGHARMMM